LKGKIVTFLVEFGPSLKSWSVKRQLWKFKICNGPFILEISSRNSVRGEICSYWQSEHSPVVTPVGWLCLQSCEAPGFKVSQRQDKAE